MMGLPRGAAEVTAGARSHTLDSIAGKQDELVYQGSDPFAGPVTHALQRFVTTRGEKGGREYDGENRPAQCRQRTSRSHSH